VIGFFYNYLGIMASSFQSRLSKIQARLKRKLSDNHLKNVGYDQRLIHVTFTEDKYGDETITIGDFNTILGWIQFPNNSVPLFTTEGYESGITVYDLLPIKGYFRFSDNIEKGDLIIIKYLLDPDSDETKIILLRVAEHVGSFSNTLIYQEFNLAPYNLDIENFPTLQTEIERLEAEEL
jgi:hypothetical protein